LLGGPRALNPARPRSVSQVRHEVKRKDGPRSGRWPPETPWIATDRDSVLFGGACAGRVTGNFRPKPPTREPWKSTAGGRVSKSSFFNQRGGGGRRCGHLRRDKLQAASARSCGRACASAAVTPASKNFRFVMIRRFERKASEAEWNCAAAFT